MTLIATHLCRHGIVLSSDSNLSDGTTGLLAATGPKTFAIPYLNAGLSFAGAYGVGSESMDTWMPRFITDSQAAGCATLGDFAERLRDAFQTGTAGQSPDIMLAHIAGYATGANGFHPEFHFVRNTPGMTSNGEYELASPIFTTTEDFHARDCKHRNEPSGFGNDGTVQFYFNGFPSGRMAYLAAVEHVGPFLRGVWNTPVLGFRPPSTLAEFVGYVRLHMTVIHELFAMSGQTEIGGDIQTLAIAPPESGQSSALNLCHVGSLP
ncbi:hypothetical protein R5W24_003958 [Gemmata sp. JC717]|uniref:hypothetical protein n=1 Tax=Gemmata algarum TaxID=2975278 RepID=UPI0021BB1FEB|nr:hypothetical protein [Gemmata algarum]MDY3554829.1 hypothetical protein [Gemmata algarum]